MNLVALAPHWLVVIMLFLLLAAATEDAWRMQISDSFSVAILLGAGLAILLAGPAWSLWQNMALVLAVLVVGTFLFARGGMGGGDVKLMGAASLWFDWSMGWRMLVAVALAGGLEAILVTLIRLLPWSDGARSRVALRQRQEGLPYGIAIAAGVALSIWQSWR
ncbi:A24 family peptidase [Sphingomonas jaspsi]|uniref:A24 family peptidase n=1 Tax=Sphingomonas jaspsi TaxID=392409 RepID=UPI0004B0B05F|nr:prepilin peptidase [Sphingomonas jaspsi]